MSPWSGEDGPTAQGFRFMSWDLRLRSHRLQEPPTASKEGKGPDENSGWPVVMVHGQRKWGDEDGGEKPWTQKTPATYGDSFTSGKTLWVAGEYRAPRLDWDRLASARQAWVASGLGRMEGYRGSRRRAPRNRAVFQSQGDIKLESCVPNTVNLSFSQAVGVSHILLGIFWDFAIHSSSPTQAGGQNGDPHHIPRLVDSPSLPGVDSENARIFRACPK